MIYTEATKKAIKYMFEKHKNQVDKSGIPYVFHPWHLAEQMDDEDSTIVALLHDVVEDTDTTIEDIEKEGFNQNIIDALKMLTHDKSIDYFDYVKKIGTNKLARKVKIADLKHNMDKSRLDEITQKDIDRANKYEKCLEYLLSLE